MIKAKKKKTTITIFNAYSQAYDDNLKIKCHTLLVNTRDHVLFNKHINEQLATVEFSL